MKQETVMVRVPKALIEKIRKTNYCFTHMSHSQIVNTALGWIDTETSAEENQRILDGYEGRTNHKS